MVAQLRCSRIARLAVIVCVLALAACSPAATPAPARPTPVPTATALPAGWTPPDSPAGPIEISYIDSSGFLIAGAGKKVLIDAHHLGVPAEIRTAIETARPPFDGVDLILITHNHYDHFHAGTLGKALEASPAAVVATTAQTVADMERSYAGFAGVKERIKGFDPARGERMQVTLNGIGLEVLNLPHGATPDNVGFIIHLAGKKLLHTGDVINPGLPAVYNLTADGLDLAFVPLFYLTDSQYLKEDGRGTIVDVVGAEWIVPMHCDPEEYALGNTYEVLKQRYPKSMLFRTRMEPQVLP